MRRRDKRCRADGCSIPATWCEAHHQKTWSEGGETDLKDISDSDFRRTVEAARQLCAPAAEVIWTRHRGEPDLTPSIRGWFAAAGFEEVGFVAPEGDAWSVGVHRLVAPPRPLEPGRHWFTFLR